MNSLTVTNQTGMPTPEEYGTMYAIDEITKRIDNIVDAYKEYKIAEAMETTKRTAYREQARVEITRLQEATKKFEIECNNKKETALKLIDTLNNILMTREVLDENTTVICRDIIKNVMSW